MSPTVFPPVPAWACRSLDDVEVVVVARGGGDEGRLVEVADELLGDEGRAGYALVAQTARKPIALTSAPGETRSASIEPSGVPTAT